MSTVMDEIKRWTAKRKSALVLEVLQGKTTVAEASRAHDLLPSEIEEGKRGMENALRANPQDIREQYESRLKELQMNVTIPVATCRFFITSTLLAAIGLGPEEVNNCSALIERGFSQEVSLNRSTLSPLRPFFLASKLAVGPSFGGL